MGMPQIPKGTNRPTLDETFIDLLESIALEEMAMAHIINAEGEKMQEVIKRYERREICHTQLESSFKETQFMMHNLIMKEWLLENRMNSILKLAENNNCKINNCNCDKCRISVKPPMP